MVASMKLDAAVIEKAVSEVSKQKGPSVPQTENTAFKEMFDMMNSGEEFARELGISRNELGLPDVGVDSISAAGIPIDESKLKVGIDGTSGVEKVVSLLSQVNDGQMKMEQLVNEVLFSGKRFSNQELLAVQAYIYHFAQLTELVVKTADQGVSSLKAVLNTNIQ